MSPEFRCTASSTAVDCRDLPADVYAEGCGRPLGVYRHRIRAVWKVLLHRSERQSWFFRSRGKVFYDVAKWSKVGGSGGSPPPSWDRSATGSRPAAVKAGPRAEMSPARSGMAAVMPHAGRGTYRGPRPPTNMPSACPWWRISAVDYCLLINERRGLFGSRWIEMECQ